MEVCVFCESGDSKSIYKSNSIEVVKCKTCNLVYQRRSKIELNEEAKLSNYYSSRKVENKNQDLFRIRRDKKIVENINQLTDGNELLVDVGSGWGNFLGLCDSFNARVGIEPNSEQAKMSKEMFKGRGVEIINDMYNLNSLKNKSVDVMTFVQVLEHVANPIETLNNAYKHLKDKGLCVIDVPNYHNPRILLFRLFGLKSLVEGDFIVPHTFYYSYNSLKAIAEKCGFRLVKCDIGQYAIKLNLPFPLTVIDEISKLFKIGSLTFYLKKES